MIIGPSRKMRLYLLLLNYRARLHVNPEMNREGDRDLIGRPYAMLNVGNVVTHRYSWSEVLKILCVQSLHVLPL